MLYITGDCHGDYRRFNTEIFPEQKGMTRKITKNSAPAMLFSGLNISRGGKRRCQTLKNCRRVKTISISITGKWILLSLIALPAQPRPQSASDGLTPIS